MMLRMCRGLQFTLIVRFFNKYYVATIPKSRIKRFFCSCIVMAQYQRAFQIHVWIHTAEATYPHLVEWHLYLLTGCRIWWLLILGRGEVMSCD